MDRKECQDTCRLEQFAKAVLDIYKTGGHDPHYCGHAVKSLIRKYGLEEEVGGQSAVF